ncbi:MAG: hypothetical protein AAF744_12705 [Pseudomonadota bacterium]
MQILKTLLTLALMAAPIPLTAQVSGVWSCASGSLVVSNQGTVQLSRQWQMQLSPQGGVYGEGVETNAHGNYPMRFEGTYYIEGNYFAVTARKEGGFYGGQYAFNTRIVSNTVMASQQVYPQGGGIEVSCQRLQ